MESLGQAQRALWILGRVPTSTTPRRPMETETQKRLRLEQQRIVELLDDGYIYHHNGIVQLTEKGWAVLYAHADHPIIKPSKR